MGFGQEIKDFIGAWQAGDKIAGSSDDRAYKKLRVRRLQQQADDADNPELKGLARDRLKAQINRLNRGPRARDPELTKGRQLDNEYKAMRNKQFGDGPAAAPSAADGAVPYAAPPSRGGAPQSALDVDEPYQTSQLEDQEDDQDDQEATQMAARGGLVTRRGYADGGLVEDDEDDAPAAAEEVDPDTLDREDALDDGKEDTASALPVNAPARAAAPAAKTLAYSPQAAHDATLAGVKYAAKELGHGEPEEGGSAVDMSARSRTPGGGSRAYQSGAGAASHDEMQKVYKAIDPENKMSDSERTMAALSTVYEWKLKNNDPQGADRAAASMVQYYRQVSDRYKAMSAAAAEKGDLDGAMKMALKAHANVPDGMDMKLEPTKDGKIKYSMTDAQTGKVVENTLATPEQILAFASKGSMHTFDDLLVRSAANRAEVSKPGKGAAGYKVADRAKADEQVDAAVADLPDKGDGLKDQLPEIKGTSFQLHAANPSINKNDALRATLEMTQIRDAADLEKPSFAPAGKPTDAGVPMKMSNGQTVTIPNELIPRLAAQRKKNADAFTAAAEKNKGSADRFGSTIEAAKKMLTPGPRSPRAPEGPVDHPATFSLPRQALSLDEAPPGSVPNRGLGER
jgi:hypothetical protein